MQKINHYIDGTNFEGNSGKTSDVYNPATGQIVRDKIDITRIIVLKFL